jgi:hypothetical protein
VPGQEDELALGDVEGDVLEGQCAVGKRLDDVLGRITMEYKQVDGLRSTVDG